MDTTCHHIVGTKIVHPTSAPWLSYPGVYQARMHRRKALLAVRANYSDPSLRAPLRAANAAWRKVSKEAKQQSYTSLCQQIMSTDNKLHWSLFKRAAPSQFSSMASIVDATGALPINHAASLDNLCAAFLHNSLPPAPSSLSTHQLLEQQVATWADTTHPTTSIPSHPSDHWTFTPAEVKEQCTKQFINTAPGPDTILPVFLRHAGDAAWTVLAHLYTFSWTHSATPQAWKEANVMALYKGADSKSSASSYRPISMTSIVIRTFEHLIHQRLAKELEDRDYFADAQFGFRRGRSTSDAIYHLHSSIQRVLKASPQGDSATLQCPVLFLDIQKAFDRVDHAILLQRLHDAGITGKAWLWIRSFLSDRRMRCVDASEYSSWQPVQYGVPQGCVLSPLLFLIFINDLQQTIARDPRCSYISPTFFADDGAIGPHPTNAIGFISSYPTTYLHHLQRAISHLDDWCKSSRMKFGPSKTHLVVFTLRKTPDHTPYNTLTLCGFTIEVKPEYKYLGVLLTSRLTWDRHLKYAIQKARKASSLVTRVALRAQPHACLTATRLLVLGYVIPIYSYGILFWGRFSTLPAIATRTLQAAAATPLRAALQLPTTTHQLGVLEMCNIPTVESLALSAQLSHLRRMEGNVLPADHPSRVLHTASVTKALNHSARQTKQVGPVLLPAKALNTSVFIGVSVYPPLLSDPYILSNMPPSLTLPLHLPAPQGSDCGRRYWDLPSSTRTAWSKANFPYKQPSPLSPPPSLHASLTWSLASAQGLTPAAIHRLRWLSSHAEWRQQHLPSNHPAGTPPPLHSTDCPLTRCKPSPGLAPFLQRLSPDSHSQQVTRARLLLGRARTGTVLRRFAKAGTAATVNPNCLRCSVPNTPPVLETISHLLLDCPEYDAARTKLQADFAVPPALPLPPILTLSTILVAACPPHPFTPKLLPRLIRLTTSFLGAIAAQRAASGLSHLDTG